MVFHELENKNLKSCRFSVGFMQIQAAAEAPVNESDM